MNLLEKPGSIKPKKKDDMDGQNSNQDQMIDSEIPIMMEQEGKDLAAQQNKESGSEFDLSISNVELQRLYNFPESDIPCANQLNQWLNQQTLYWNIQGQQVQFNFPEHLLSSHAEQPIEILPQSVTYKPNSLFPSSFLVDNATKQTQQQNKKNGQQKEPPKPVSQKVYDPLNNIQLSDIWKTGMFTVHYGYGEPEMWMIRPWVFYGKKRCGQFIKDAFVYSKQQFLQIKRRFYTEQTLDMILHNRKNLQVNSENCECVCLDINMLEGLRVILGIPIHLIILLIGIPLYNVDAQKLESAKIKVISNRIEKEILGERMGKYTDVAFLQHFHENKGIYLGLDINFNEETEIVQTLKMIAEGNLKLGSQDKELVKLELQDKIYENLIKKICAALASNYDVNAQILTSLENTFKAFIVCNRQVILGKAGVPNFGKPENIIKELQMLKLQKQENLVSVLFNELKKGFGILEERHLRNSIKVVSKKNHQEYTRSIPKVIREVIDGRVVYSEEWKREIQVPTSFFFWKVIYLFVASYLRINHFIDFFIYVAIYSPCGLKSAIYSNPFYGQFKVNSNTGKFDPVPGSQIMPVTQIYKEIKKEALDNIQKFEDEPDHGLLGKSITRICNRLDNWVFRMFLIGFLGVNIFLRLCFFIIGLVSLILVPFSFVLAPIYSIFCMIVCLICYDFTVPLGHIEWDLPVFAPLFDLLIWRLFGRGLGQILLSFIMIVFHIASGIILIIFGIVIYIARRLIDLSVYIFIYSCGRVPGGDSYIAWRVTRQQRQYLSNDNIASQKKYNNSKQNLAEQPTIMDQLTQEQIHQLVDAEFDRETLDIYRSEMHTKINDPVLQNDKKIRKLLEYLPFDFAQNKLSQEYYASSHKLKQALDTQILSRKKNLPIITRRGQPNFLYKREAILNMFYLLQTYLAQKYGEHPFYSKFMWKNHQCEVGSYDNLALHFLSLIFFDKKVPPQQVLDKLTLKESQNKQIQVKQQIEEFFEQQYGSPTTRFIEPPQFQSFSQFLSKVMKRQDPKQPVIALRSLNLNNLDEFIILNTILLNPDNVIHFN